MDEKPQDIEYTSVVLEGGSSHMQGRSSGVFAYPTDFGDAGRGIMLQISAFNSLTDVKGHILLNREHALILADEIIRAAQSKEQPTVIYFDHRTENWD